MDKQVMEKKTALQESVKNKYEAFKNSGFYKGVQTVNAFIREHTWLVLVVCLITMLVTELLKFRIYAPEGFSDAYRMTSFLNGTSGNINEVSFLNTSAVFSFLTSLFGPMNMQMWGWLLLLPGAVVFAFLVVKAKPEGIFSSLVLIGFSVLLPFYVFMTGVDYIQYIVFFLIALVLFYVPGQLFKLLVSIVLMVPVIVFFREYYMLMAGFSVFVFAVALLYRRPKSLKEKSIFLCILACVVVLLIFIIRFFFTKEVDTLFTVRTITNQTLGSNPAPNKLILDAFPLDRSVPGFLANYIAAAIRLLFPLELLADASDIPFVLFQIMMFVLIIYQMRRSRMVQGRTAVYSVIFAFFLMSFFFEPDFGSWFRHEAAAFPILWIGIGQDVEERKRNHV